VRHETFGHFVLPLAPGLLAGMAYFSLVLGKATSDVRRDSGVEAPIVTSYEVQIPTNQTL